MIGPYKIIMGDENEKGGDLLNPKKRKPKGTLVNPYIKKRKV
jgi:hypothetical protein